VSTVSFAAATWRIRAAIRRQLAIDLRRLREMEQEITQLDHRIAEQRGALAALHAKHPAIT
jgi:hypothetical protein